MLFNSFPIFSKKPHQLVGQVAKHTYLSTDKVPVKLIRTKRRTIGLRVTNQGELIIRAPKWLNQTKIWDILDQKQTWITKAINRLRQQNQIRQQFNLSPEQINQPQKQAKLSLLQDLTQISRDTGLRFANFHLSSAKTLWGSCSGKNSISLNWRLTLSPENLKKYVIIHELAHTVEKNHNSSFWTLVAKFDPDYKVHRQQLKQFAYLMG
jgi:predicted metal-dependent hydrolase